MRRITKQERREFVRRCKELAAQDGNRINYYPARWNLELFGQLRILYQPDEDYIYISAKEKNLPINYVSWSEVFVEFKSNAKWSPYEGAHHHLDLLRKLMVLDDLSDV